ncbi:hypothetical protein, partial [Acinetobacter baumannii]|uniref:hypothetical protein n=1 Tax=Acinetobacter baumannii TaxID=470 RepID=UPI0013D0339F
FALPDFSLSPVAARFDWGRPRLCVGPHPRDPRQHFVPEQMETIMSDTCRFGIEEEFFVVDAETKAVMRRMP